MEVENILECDINLLSIVDRESCSHVGNYSPITDDEELYSYRLSCFNVNILLKILHVC